MRTGDLDGPDISLWQYIIIIMCDAYDILLLLLLYLYTYIPICYTSGSRDDVSDSIAPAVAAATCPRFGQTVVFGSPSRSRASSLPPRLTTISKFSSFAFPAAGTPYACAGHCLASEYLRNNAVSPVPKPRSSYIPTIRIPGYAYRRRLPANCTRRGCLSVGDSFATDTRA